MQDLQADNQRILQARLERDTMLKKLVKWEKWLLMQKNEAQVQENDWASESSYRKWKKCSYELKAQVSTLSLSIAEKLLKRII
jgi:outer membrane protease